MRDMSFSVYFHTESLSVRNGVLSNPRSFYLFFLACEKVISGSLIISQDKFFKKVKQGDEYINYFSVSSKTK